MHRHARLPLAAMRGGTFWLKPCRTNTQTAVKACVRITQHEHRHKRKCAHRHIHSVEPNQIYFALVLYQIHLYFIISFFCRIQGKVQMCLEGKIKSWFSTISCQWWKKGDIPYYMYFYCWLCCFTTYILVKDKGTHTHKTTKYKTPDKL